jgi:hypothetical protein
MKLRLSAGRAFFCCIVFVALAAQTAGGAPPEPPRAADPWQAVRGLLGSWDGDVKGEPGSGRCEREYRLALKDKFIHVTGRSTYPPQERNPKGEVHEDIGVSEDGRRVVFVT